MPPLLTSSVGIAQRFAQMCPTTMVGISYVSGLTIRLSVPPYELQYITGTRKGNRASLRSSLGETVMRKLEQRSSVNLIFLIRVRNGESRPHELMAILPCRATNFEWQMIRVHHFVFMIDVHNEIKKGITRER